TRTTRTLDRGSPRSSSADRALSIMGSTNAPLNRLATNTRESPAAEPRAGGGALAREPGRRTRAAFFIALASVAPRSRGRQSEKMAQLVPFGHEIISVGRVGRHLDGHPLGDVQAVSF